MASFPAVAVLQDGGAENLACWKGIQSSGVHCSESSKSPSPPTRFQSDEISSSGDELTTKVRKPYTITKQRERWTEGEHQKFLEALKMHGRAWRRIEEHIGTKTAVQIRSHAQKFFSKLEREALAKGIPVEKAQDISIPPPRPKRKPSHPYPRKAGTTVQSGSSTVEEENRSPPAVSSAPDRLLVGLNLGGGTRKNAAFTPYNARARPLVTNENINSQDTKMESSSTNSSPSSLKLFGKMVLVPTIDSGLNNGRGAFREVTSLKQEMSPFNCKIPKDQKMGTSKGASHALSPKPQTELLDKSSNAAEAASNTLASESGTGLLEGSGETTANLSCAEKHMGQQDSDEQPSSEADNNSNYLHRKPEAPTVVPGYPRNVPVQHVNGGIPESSHQFMKYGPNAASSLAHEFSAMSVLNTNRSLPEVSGQLPDDNPNSVQTNCLLPFPAMPGPFTPAYNMENFGCLGGFIAPSGSAPNGSLAPWHLAPSSALHHPAYAAATLAAAFWPGLVSGVSVPTTAEAIRPSEVQSGVPPREETSAAAAVTAATVAAASAWWTLHGAVLPPFLHLGIYGPVVAAMAAEAAAVAAAAAASGNASPVCKTEPLMETRNQEQMVTGEEEGEGEGEILDAIPVNPVAKRLIGKVTMDDGRPLKCKSLSCPQSGSADCLPQGSPSGSEKNTISCMEEFNDEETQTEQQNSQTEEQDKAVCSDSPDGQKETSRKFIKERSSSGSNTPSSAEPEIDPYLGTNIEVIKGDNEKSFEFNGMGSGSSEADALVIGEAKGYSLPEVKGKMEKEKNNKSTKQDEKIDNGGKHFHKDRCQSLGFDPVGRRSKCGGHINDTWKAVSEEGRIAFQALFARDVLPQSFSPPHELRGQGTISNWGKESLCNVGEQNRSKASVEEMKVDVPNRMVNQNDTYNVDVHTEGTRLQEIPLKSAASPGRGKKVMDSEATISDQSLEGSVIFETGSSLNEHAAVDKSTKSSAISNYGNVRSGRGFVPYRCSIEAKKNRLHKRPGQNCSDDIRGEKRICLKQEVEE
eukprot:Gb_28874 [translate_table: standard]